VRFERLIALQQSSLPAFVRGSNSGNPAKLERHDKVQQDDLPENVFEIIAHIAENQ